ncbi:Expansin-A32 [Chlorella vulgaris]
MGAATAQGDWQKGRATYYGTDGWSIHKGSCGFGYQYKDIGTGWDVAAIADASPEFAGSCGRCYEIRCEARSVIDGYDNSFDRSGACKAGDASVVVRTVDNCPCQYPSNAYSNKRWCCNDHSDTQGTHFDMSLWAFEKLADLKLGVAGIEFRRVPCGYRPANPAPDGPSTMPASESPAALGYSGTPYAPANLQDLYQQKLVQRFDGPGAKQGAVTPRPDGGLTLEQVLTQHGELSSSSASASASATASTGNGCTDVAPFGSTCQKEKDNKQCSKPWLLSGNYCRATCGRCTLSDSSSSAGSSDVSSSDSGSSSSSDCTDVSPPGEADCQQQKAWGKCNKAYIVKSNYCAATCERCSGGQAGASSSSSSASGSGSASATASACASASASAKASASSTKQQQPEQKGKVQAHAKASSRRSGRG